MDLGSDWCKTVILTLHTKFCEVPLYGIDQEHEQNVNSQWSYATLKSLYIHTSGYSFTGTISFSDNVTDGPTGCGSASGSSALLNWNKLLRTLLISEQSTWQIH